MKKKSIVSKWILMCAAAVSLGACAQNRGDVNYAGMSMSTPTVDYVEQLDVYSAPHKDSFLNQLAMNYRSYAIYNARTSGYPDMGELFAQKAVAAFSGELPFPESLENWPVDNEQDSYELYTAYNDLMEQLKNDASELNPELAAEAQAKFDCWLSAAASGQSATASQCRTRFQKALTALRDCKGGKIVSKTVAQTKTQNVAAPVMVAKTAATTTQTYYPETRDMSAMRSSSAREGVIIVNNVNVPEHLINPVPVQPIQPMIFNQNIYGGNKTVSNCMDDNGYDDCVNAAVVADEPVPVAAPNIPMVGDELVTREEFINMMMAMRAELAAINARLDKLQNAAGEKTMIKVQQIPLEPTQHVMEEIFEIRFDFNKATIKPEYQELIKKLASATQESKNIKVSVVGHTDTMGSKDYNYALGGRRADAVQQMLIKYGIPASQIVAVSAGEEGLQVPTPDGVANAANRRVRVVKEVHYTEPAKPQPVAIEVQEFSESECGMYGCGE